MSEHPKLKPETSGESKIKRPLTSDMVNSAIRNLNDRGGSSLKAIKKYIEANYQIEVKNFMPHIKAYIKKSLLDGTMVQKSGVGLTGSFKLSTKVQETKRKKEKQIENGGAKEGDPKKEKVKKSKDKKVPIEGPSASSSKSGKSGTKKAKENAEDLKDKNDTKVKKDKVKKAKAKTKTDNAKDGKGNKGELKKPRLKTVTTTDAAKLKKIRISILNGKLIKRKSIGAKTKKLKGKKVVVEP